MSVSENIAMVNGRIASAAARSGRNSSQIRLVAVTKYADAGQIKEAIAQGVQIIGENRIQDAVEKIKGLPKVEKHFLGAVQSNKIRLIAQYFDCVQSISSIGAARKLDQECRMLGKALPVLVEVNIGKEETKHGVIPENALELCNGVTKFLNLRLEGLMCIAPYFDKKEIEKTRPYFRQMKELNEKIGLKWISMGMSNDFEIAIEEGSTMVRIGRMIFNQG